MATALHSSPTIAHFILGEKEGIPPHATAQMQSWVLISSAYQYHIQHTPSKQNHLAYCLSRLFIPNEDSDRVDKVLHMVVTNQLPVVASQIARATVCDSVLGIVLKAVQHGVWPAKWHSSLFQDLLVVDGYLL